MWTMAHWQEWKDTCALALCGEDARRALPGFAQARYAHFAHAYATTTNVEHVPALIPTAAEAWHRFETHFRLSNGPGGKSYKDWLFARVQQHSGSPQESVEAGASLLIRDVVREHLRREFSSRWIVSASAKPDPAGFGDGSPSLEELLPDEADTEREVQNRDLDELARAGAGAAFARLDARERIALLAHEVGMSLAHPEATRAAGCGRSVLNTAFHSALMRIADGIRRQFPNEGRTVQACLACRVYEHMRRMVLAWGRSENRCAVFCKYVETQP
jgi:hypothetical protein